MAFSSFQILLIIFVLPFSALAQTDGVVPVGSSLTADETSRPWLSPLGDFAFGFRQTQDRELFLLSIWYNRIPAQTIVWFVNSIDPVPRGSTLELNSLAGLVLRDPRGQSVWKLNSEGFAEEVHQGVMNDTGNFILKGSDFKWIWNTFEHSADTILPLQELVYGSELISRKSETNFSRGRFYLRFLETGNLVLRTGSLPSNSEDDTEYYNSQTSDTAGSGSASGVRVIFEPRGSIYIRRRNNQTRVLTQLSLPTDSENFFRATLNFDGVFTHYYHPRNSTGSSGWKPLMNLPRNICINIMEEKGSGACGYNSVCRIDNSTSRPACECPEGYELIDPNDRYGSCKPKVNLNCDGIEQGSAEEVYDFLEIPDTDWPLNDYQRFRNSTEESCKQVCLEDCYCVVAIFRSNTCWKKKLPLSNGRIDVSLNAKALLKYSKRDNPVTPGPLKPRPLLGSSLTANSTSSSWLSPSGDFAFGFKETEDKDLFILAIWYDKIPTKTIVWFNNTFDPVPQGSTVALNQTGLVLRNPQGRIVWRTEHVAAAGDVDHGFMNDTGNFILKRSDNISLWESFQFPADTLLPFQDLSPGSELISRRSDTNFSEGKFHLRFLDNGNLVLTTRSVPTNREEDDLVYYGNQTSDDVNNGSTSGVRLMFEESGSLNILRRNNETKDLNQLWRPIPPASENYFRATLNFDGVFTFYYHPRSFSGMTNWEAVWWEPDDICSAITITDQKRGNGACGYNNVCSLGDSGRPICECPDGYELVNPNDSYGSCRGNFTESCGDAEQAASGQDFFDFKVVRNTNWPFFDYQRIWPSNETECRQACLQDCFCAVAVFGGDSCWKKKLPLSNGRKGDAHSGNVAFLKYRIRDVPKDQEPEPKSKPKESRTSIIVVSVLLGGSFLINFMFITASCCGVPLIYRKRRSKSHQTKNIVEKSFHCFRYKELAEATKGFKEEIGRGSFGIVYKGVIQTGSRSTVAVKKLDRVLQDAEKEFRAEVNAIGQTHHKNLVRLLGFCDEGKHRLLVYEYMTNGTLSSFLFNTTKQSWSLRTQIAIGIARGLTYLHEECTSQIIHCDIKPPNILLDDYYNARISDFGLAKLLVLNQSRTLTNIRGTKGYVAPEWFRNKQITSKVDVYSFGVLLLEIITCRRCLGDPENEEENPILTDWVWDCLQVGRLDTLVENDLEALNDWEMLERFVKVGIWCIQEDSSLRPIMRKVSQMLEGVVEVITPPCPFPFASNA